MTTGILFKRAYVGLHPEWVAFLEGTPFNGTLCLRDKLRSILDVIERTTDPANICPAAENILAFARYPLSNAKIVIFGQDPYPNRAHACGLAFSVPRGVAPPPSLRNIFGALTTQKLMVERASNADGNLEAWCEQGVILLNAALTTVEGTSAAHSHDWLDFTHKLAVEIGNTRPGLIYMLFGAAARSLKSIIPRTCATLEWGHPSPMVTANQKPLDPKNFVFCTTFKIANNMLSAAKKPQINWDPSGAAPAGAAAAAASARRLGGTLEEMMLDVDDELVCPDEEAIYAFVDGAATRNGQAGASAGYAVLIVDCTMVYQIIGKVAPCPGMPPTNNRAELMAMRDLFIFAASKDFAQFAGLRPLTVVYDSKYAAGCICDWYEKWCRCPPDELKANLDIISVAHEFKTRVESARKIVWCHIRSHKKEPADRESIEWYQWVGNARVDALAQAAAAAPDHS